MKLMMSIIATAFVVGMGTVVQGHSAKTGAAPAEVRSMDGRRINQMSDIKWHLDSPALPPGSQVVVMTGDPSASGFLSMRAKLPAGYKIPPHFHLMDEHVTVLAGTMLFGEGDKPDPNTARIVKMGGYFIAGANMHHYAIAKTASIIQLDLEGPFDITYVNPADDPRKKEQ